MITEARSYKPGDLVDYTPSAALTAGQVIDAGGMAAIASTDIAAGALGVIQIAGDVLMRAAAVAGEIGDPVGWDEDGTSVDGDTGALTTNPFDWDFPVGSLAQALTATSGRAVVHLNKFATGKPIWPNWVYESVSADKTLAATDHGKVLCVSADGKTVTLPATIAGIEAVIVNLGLSGKIGITIAPAAADKIMGANLGGTDGATYVNTKATAKRWDYVHLRGDGANGWWIVSKRGTWA
jgi:predicted RecA/RadA family phage recombinase